VAAFSAKIAKVNEITPQTNVVFLFSDGVCSFDPRFDSITTHCSIDITWFPFDVQKCHLVFLSWILDNMQLNISLPDNPDILEEYVPSDEWTLDGTSVVTFICFHVLDCD